MRKQIVGLAGAALLLALTVGVASGSPGVAGHTALPSCGTLYTPPCPPPSLRLRRFSITISSPTTSCAHAGKLLRFAITVHARAGLRRVTVFLGKKRIKTIKYKGKPKTKHFSVTITTRGLRRGVYTLTVKVRDVRGKTASKRAHFSVCR
jgi:hypothetical protein